MTGTATGAAGSTRNVVSAVESHRRGLMLSSIIGGGIGAVFGIAVGLYFGVYPGIITFVLVGGSIIRILMMEGLSPDNNVALGHEGIETNVGDQPTERILGPGIQFQVPGFGGVVPVDKREKKIDPPKFDELADDGLPVTVDGYFYRKVEDTMLSVTSVEDYDGNLLSDFKSRARFFVNQINKAENSLRFKNEFAEWLQLPPNVSSETARLHDRVREKLAENADMLKGGAASINAIMSAAGDFVRKARSWGLSIPSVEIDNFDLAAEFKKAATDAASQEKINKQNLSKNEAKATMTERLIKAGMSAKDASASVDQSLGQQIARSHEETTIGFKGLDPNEAIKDVLKPVADAVARRIGGSQPPPTSSQRFEPRQTPVNRPVRR